MGKVCPATGEGNAGQDDDHASDDLSGERFGKDGGAEDDGDNGQQVVPTDAVVPSSVMSR